MNDKIRERMALELLETVDSFHTAVREAGRFSIDIDAMREMTLFNFICHVAAPNGIRFKFVEPKEDSD